MTHKSSPPNGSIVHNGAIAPHATLELVRVGLSEAIVALGWGDGEALQALVGVAVADALGVGRCCERVEVTDACGLEAVHAPLVDALREACIPALLDKECVRLLECDSDWSRDTLAVADASPDIVDEADASTVGWLENVA